MMTQKERVVKSFRDGNEFTAKQLASQFKVGSPTKLISELRQDGYAIYLNKRVDTKGRVTHKYRLGTPTRRMVAIAARQFGAQVFQTA